MIPKARRQKIEEIARRVVERLEREWPEHEAHINELEDLAERVGREVMHEITAELLHEQAARRKRGHTACACGGEAAFKGSYLLWLVTLHGRFRVGRPYYYCDRCQSGACPLDAEWGLGPANTTPTVQSVVAALSAMVAYVQVPALLRRVRLPVRLAVKSIEQIAQRVGAQVAPAPPLVTAKATRPLAVAVDGAMLPLRYGHHQEVRCGVVYEPDADAGRTPAGEASLRKEYRATTLGSRDDLVRAVCERVAARRPTPEWPVAALGDGAPWIWEGYARYLPHRVDILDFYHVSERLAILAGTVYGEGREAAKAALAWQEERRKELQKEGPEPLLSWLRAWEPANAAAAEVKRQQLGYFEGQQGRMDYPAYLAAGLPIGSGAVEGACKHLVDDRFRGSGMHWHPATAEPLLHLRAALLTEPNLDLRRYVSPPNLA